MSPDAPTSRPSPVETTASDRVVFGAVHLDVTDLERSEAFWHGILGLEVLRRDGDGVVRLGVADAELVVLHGGATDRVRPGHSGLYHLAIHLPSEGEFARVLLRLGHARWNQAPTDHIMHWATYLDDPDGIGIELSFETLDRFGRHAPELGGMYLYDSEGQVRHGVSALDLDEVVSFLPDSDLSRPLPAQTRIGHVHLHVADVARARDFYVQTLGFVPGVENPAVGFADMTAGGTFPHRLAVNTWQGPGAPQRPPGQAGLRHFEVVLRGAGPAPGDGELLHDPAGNAIAVTTAPPPA